LREAARRGLLRGVTDDLILANRILAHANVLDAFGHVSARDEHDPSRFRISRSLAPAQVTVRDLQTMDLGGTRVGGDDRAPYAEVAIHAAIYRARPDVGAVCHSHATTVIPFGVTRTPIRPITHIASIAGAKVPVWDSRDAGFGGEMLVTSAAQGDSLAKTLGPQRAALMRGHGCVVATPHLKETVLTAIALATNAEQLGRALALGAEVRYLSDEEIAAASAIILAPLSLDRAWGYWVARAGE
jgi:ribulose-5-phosphate 4-epimerase/fuculose-1-phosphate aldolase